MAKDNKVSMPSSTAGITRFFDDYKSKIEFKPGHLVVMIIVVIILEFILHSMG
ncbi:MAG: preprotein translocase subunit Sec61beta [Nanobdellota archaeon]